MISTSDKRLDLLSRLRKKNQFGISEEVRKISDQQSKAETDKEKFQYTKHINPEEVLGHLSTLPQFDLREEFDPGSSSPEELEARCKELRYRASWLESLLHITNEELKVFSGALKDTQP